MLLESIGVVFLLSAGYRDDFTTERTSSMAVANHNGFLINFVSFFLKREISFFQIFLFNHDSSFSLSLARSLYVEVAQIWRWR